MNDIYDERKVNPTRSMGRHLYGYANRRLQKKRLWNSLKLHFWINIKLVSIDFCEKRVIYETWCVCVPGQCQHKGYELRRRKLDSYSECNRRCVCLCHWVNVCSYIFLHLIRNDLKRKFTHLIGPSFLPRCDRVPCWTTNYLLWPMEFNNLLFVSPPSAILCRSVCELIYRQAEIVREHSFFWLAM